MSEENIGPDVQPIITQLWDTSLGPRMAGWARIDGEWLYQTNKFLNNYAQIIAKFRYGHVPLKTRLRWDAEYGARLEEGAAINAKYLAAAVPQDGTEQLQIEDLRGNAKGHTMDMVDGVASAMKISP